MLNLNQDTLCDLALLKKAYEISYQQEFSDDAFVSQLIASVEDSDLSVWETFCELKTK